MSPRAHVAKFCGQLRLIRSVLRVSKFSVLKLIEIVILWVYYTIPFDFSLFRHFWVSLFNVLNYVVWLRITEEGSVPEMCIWPPDWDCNVCLTGGRLVGDLVGTSLRLDATGRRPVGHRSPTSHRPVADRSPTKSI